MSPIHGMGPKLNRLYLKNQWYKDGLEGIKTTLM